MRVVYLHGFASSAQSSKARMFADALGACGVPADIPDLNQPSFRTMTITRMIDHALAAIDSAPDPVALVGSSLGAFVAVHAAARRPKVDRLVLLAPALDFADSRLSGFGEEAVARWRETGEMDVFHYGFGRVERIGFALYEDAAAYDAFALDVRVPVLVFHGTRDSVVSPAVSERFAQDRTNVTVRLVDDDHQLLASMPAILEEAQAFLGVAPGR